MPLGGYRGAETKIKRQTKWLIEINSTEKPVKHVKQVRIVSTVSFPALRRNSTQIKFSEKEQKLLSSAQTEPRLLSYICDRPYSQWN